MRTRSLACLLLLAAACGDGDPGGGDADGGPDPTQPDAGDEAPDYAAVFDADRVIRVELELAAADRATLFDTPDTDTYVPAALAFDGEEIGTVGVRLKGNSSFNAVAMRGSTRYSFKLDFDRFDESLRLHGLKKLNLNNGFKDPTLLRERLAYDAFREAGVPASRASSVELWIDGDYQGLYTAVEQVDKRYLADRFDDDDGDLYKPERPSGTLEYRGASIADYGGAEIKTNEETTDHAAFLHFVDVLNNTPDEQLESSLEQVLDVDTFLRYLAVSTALSNLDSYQGTGHNYYLYFDPNSGRATVLPWDLNEAYGVFTCNRPLSDMLEWSIDQPTCSPMESMPLIGRVLSVTSYRDRYRQYLLDMVDGPLDPTTFRTQIAAMSAVIADSVEADTTKFFDTASWETALEADLGNGPGTMPVLGLGHFADARSAFIGTQLR